MDPRLRDYYREELRHLRDGTEEFARVHPDIAKRLDLSTFDCQDPYVERLLEGFAYMAARVRLKLDAEFPRFTQHLLDHLFPDLTAPTPSMAVVELRPDPKSGTLSDGFRVPRGTDLVSPPVGRHEVACTYRTAHEVTLWPLELVGLRYLSGASLGDQVPRRSGGTGAALRLRLRSHGGLPLQQLPIERLTFFLRGADAATIRLYETFFTQTQGIAMQASSLPSPWSHRSPDGREVIRSVGFADDEALLPQSRRSFQGYRLLKEYFVFPQRFMFVEIDGLREGFAACEAPELDLFVQLERPDPVLEALNHAEDGSIEAPLVPFATPAVNLFEWPHTSFRPKPLVHEQHVPPDRFSPSAYEIYRIDEVEGFGGSDRPPTLFRPLYGTDHTTDLAVDNAFFTVRREPRGYRRDKQEQRRLQQRGAQPQSGAAARRPAYPGSEVYVALVDANEAPWRGDLRQLSPRMLCTNRGLPTQLRRVLRERNGNGEATRSDFALQGGEPVAWVRCLAGPTRPIPAPPDGEHCWRLINQLSLNYLTLTDDGQRERGAEALRGLLRLYADQPVEEWQPEDQARALDVTMIHRINGLQSVHLEPIARPLPPDPDAPGRPLAFARGLEVTLTIDENAFQGTSAHLFGGVLEQFVARYVSMNSFTETVLRSTERGLIDRWPPRLGRCAVL